MRHHALPNPDSVSQRILKALRAGARTTFDLQAHMPDVTRLSIHNTLHSLENAGKVERDGKVPNLRSGPREVSKWKVSK